MMKAWFCLMESTICVSYFLMNPVFPHLLQLLLRFTSFSSIIPKAKVTLHAFQSCLIAVLCTLYNLLSCIHIQESLEKVTHSNPFNTCTVYLKLSRHYLAPLELYVRTKITHAEDILRSQSHQNHQPQPPPVS